MNQYLEFAKEMCLEAGKIMTKYFTCDNGADYKYDQTIVTKADTEINHLLIQKVSERFPTHAVDGEEEKFGASNYVWVCDPVDGTAVYARHIPISVFSLALVVDGEPVVGVVYDPFLKNLYSAIKNGGAFLNNQPIHVNDFELSSKKTVCHYDMWPSCEFNMFALLEELGKKAYFLSIGSIIRASMCVANGDFSLAIFPGTTNKHCDIAAAKIIVEEAGGTVTNLYGENQRYDKDILGAVISNGNVHEEVIAQIKQIFAK